MLTRACPWPRPRGSHSETRSAKHHPRNATARAPYPVERHAYIPPVNRSPRRRSVMSPSTMNTSSQKSCTWGPLGLQSAPGSNRSSRVYARPSSSAERTRSLIPPATEPCGVRHGPSGELELDLLPGDPPSRRTCWAHLSGPAWRSPARARAYAGHWPQHCRSVKVVPQRPGSCSSISPSWRSSRQLVGAHHCQAAAPPGPWRTAAAGSGRGGPGEAPPPPP